MIKVEEAEKNILETLLECSNTIQDIRNCYREILAEEITADRDYPPFDRVAMDGIAISFNAFKEGNRNFIIQDTQKAGQAQLTLKGNEYCIEVMTGCSLPIGCDCVIKVEDLTINDNKALLEDNLDLVFYNNIHSKGSDYKKNDKLISIGTELLMTHISIMASVGKKYVLVKKSPSIAFVSTGDELIPIDAKNIEDYQIRISNSYAMSSSLSKNWNNKIQIFHIKDSVSDLKTELSNIINDFDVVILSGGVSMGKFDYIPSVMKELEVKEIFHKIAQKPGKPFWFGKTKNQKPIFGLPGNPVSSMVCFYRYILPYLYKSIGKKTDFKRTILLAEEIKTNNNLVTFLPVKIFEEGSKIFATSLKNNGSGDFYSLEKSDGFIEVELNKGILNKNTEVSFYSWKL